jgi:hypothetical protein
MAHTRKGAAMNTSSPLFSEIALNLETACNTRKRDLAVQRGDEFNTAFLQFKQHVDTIVSNEQESLNPKEKIRCNQRSGFGMSWAFFMNSANRRAFFAAP